MRLVLNLLQFRNFIFSGTDFSIFLVMYKIDISYKYPLFFIYLFINNIEKSVPLNFSLYLHQISKNEKESHFR